MCQLLLPWCSPIRFGRTDYRAAQAEDIRELLDVSAVTPDENAAVLVTIRVSRQDPLEGEAALEDAERIPFSGWLGLLKVLSELLSSGGDDSGSTGELGGQLDA